MVLFCYGTHKVKAGCQIQECDTGLTVTRSLRLNMILPWRNLSCVQENCLHGYLPSGVPFPANRAGNGGRIFDSHCVNRSNNCMDLLTGLGLCLKKRSSQFGNVIFPN